MGVGGCACSCSRSTDTSSAAPRVRRRSGRPSTGKPPSWEHALRQAELWLAVAAAVVLALAALAGERVSPGDSWDDPRASTFSSGPRGAKGLAQALRRLGIQVRVRRRPVFDLARASTPLSSGEVHAFLDIYVPPAEEIAAVRE